MKRYAREECLRFGIDFLTKRGAGPKKARIVAETAVNIQAMGIHTHGLAVLPYLDQNMPDPIDPKAEPKVVRETGATALIDAHNGFSQLALNLAVEIAERKAADQGVAMIGIRRCCWLGALGPYLVSLAQNGFMASALGPDHNLPGLRTHRRDRGQVLHQSGRLRLPHGG